MPTIMCTRRLWRVIAGRGQLAQRSPSPNDEGKLQVWSARELFTPSGALVVALEETTYLTVVCPLLPLPGFCRSLAASVGVQLETLGIPRRTCEAEASAIGTRSRFARNDNRSLLGSLNDVTWRVAEAFGGRYACDPTAIEAVQAELNEMPHAGREPPFPSQAVRLLFMPGASA